MAGGYQSGSRMLYIIPPMAWILIPKANNYLHQRSRKNLIDLRSVLE
jgi:hypothetical protein